MVEAIRDGLGRLVGPGVAVSVEVVDRIPPEASGKRPIIKTRKLSGAGPASLTAGTGTSPGGPGAPG
jgi:hypothetical protein